MEQPLAIYQKLGGKTLYFFVSKYTKIILIAIVLGGLIIYGVNFLPANLQNFVSLINFSVIALGILIILGTILVGWLEYSHYRVEIYTDFIKIMRGVFVVEEIGIPYKRIVEIKIQRSLSEQMMGLANIQITIFREDDRSTPGNDSMITLPALTSDIASKIQHSILERTNIHDILTEEPTPRS